MNQPTDAEVSFPCCVYFLLKLLQVWNISDWFDDWSIMYNCWPNLPEGLAVNSSNKYMFIEQSQIRAIKPPPCGVSFQMLIHSSPASLIFHTNPPHSWASITVFSSQQWIKYLCPGFEPAAFFRSETSPLSSLITPQQFQQLTGFFYTPPWEIWCENETLPLSLCCLLFLSLQWSKLNIHPFNHPIYFSSMQKSFESESPWKRDPTCHLALISNQLWTSLFFCTLFSFSSSPKEGWWSYSVSSRGGTELAENRKIKRRTGLARGKVG